MAAQISLKSDLRRPEMWNKMTPFCLNHHALRKNSWIWCNNTVVHYPKSYRLCLFFNPFRKITILINRFFTFIAIGKVNKSCQVSGSIFSKIEYPVILYPVVSFFTFIQFKFQVILILSFIKYILGAKWVTYFSFNCSATITWRG